ncbi:unnamed protein product [Oreochromis niloticus]|nr:unnamed protein product [Mustela putorius furo]
MVRPSVSLLQPSSEKLSGGPVTLACLLTGYSPQGAEVRWEVDGTEVTEGVLNSLEEEKSSRYSSSSTLMLSQENWMDAEVFSCRVNHHDHRQAKSFRKNRTLVAGVVRPTLTVLPHQSSGTLVCLASGGFPLNWKLGWKVGGTSTSSGVSNSLEAQGTDGRYSWSSTLSLSADQWRKAGSVTCEASLSGQSPVTQTLDPAHCSE